MKQPLSILLILCCFMVNAQVNLVPNPSFEEYNSCPTQIPSIEFSQIDFPFLANWFSPINTTPDYFNICGSSLPNLSVPNNLAGFQPPRSGNGYCGIVGLTHLAERREYISCRLTSQLLANKVYSISWHVSLGATSYVGTKAINRMGCWLSDSIKLNDNNLTIIKPQIENDETRMLNDTVNWVSVSSLYKAIGNEQFITIGNFHNDAETKSQLIVGNPSLFNSYYYIDDVSVTIIENTLLDTTLCIGNQIEAGLRPNFNTCVWNNGDSSVTRVLNTEGIYWVTSFSGNVTVTDTFRIHFLNPQTTITDTSFCGDSTIILDAGTASNYLWNTNHTTPSISVSQSGIYWVQKTATNCTGIDTFLVTQNPLPIITSLKDTTVCFDEVAQLLLDAGQFKSYLWKPTGETTRTIYSTQAQVYLLSVTDSNNCSTTKQVAVMETCPDFVFVPNAFTPNGDGLNDVFLPNTRNLESYTMSIVNRWGEIVFTTTNPQQGWNGEGAHDGVYVAIINYTVTGKPAQQLKQTVTLLR